MDAQITFPLNSGYSIPAVGLGTWKSKPGEVKHAVLAALKAGYRHIDCAAVYGNEREVGEALQEAFADNIVSRQDVFITSKCWCNDLSFDSVPRACEKTLEDLQLDYLDLYLIHWPLKPEGKVWRRLDLAEIWPAFEGLVRSSKVRSIGLSNFGVKLIREVLGLCKIRPAVNQVELHPALRQDQLVSFCASEGIVCQAYSPLGSPDSAAMLGRSQELVPLLHHPTIVQVASKVGRSPAQVLLRWGVERGTCVLPKSTNAERIAANLDVFNWALPEADKAELDTVEPQVHYVSPGIFISQQGDFKTKEDFWDYLA